MDSFASRPRTLENDTAANASVATGYFSVLVPQMATRPRIFSVALIRMLFMWLVTLSATVWYMLPFFSRCRG
ncbi:hypothetical protein BDZ89DRAFT_385089 [Hymenopellis radicata]|nr:hypothetical protein BDZ89DRAFT_385089 [Hymenopellis radicata]